MAYIDDFEKFQPRDEFHESDDNHSLDFFTKRNIMDGLKYGYLNKQQWLRIKMWVDKSEPAYVLKEYAPTDVKDDNYTAWKEKQLRRCINEGDAGSWIPKTIDIQSRQRKENRSHEYKVEKNNVIVPKKKEEKKSLSAPKNTTYYRSSSLPQCKFNKIRVIGLTPDLKTKQVVKIFAEFGKIVSTLHLSSTRRDGKRCALVIFADNESACRAMETVNGKHVNGSIIKVTAIQ